MFDIIFFGSNVLGIKYLLSFIGSLIMSVRGFFAALASVPLMTAHAVASQPDSFNDDYVRNSVELNAANVTHMRAFDDLISAGREIERDVALLNSDANYRDEICAKYSDAEDNASTGDFARRFEDYSTAYSELSGKMTAMFNLRG
ncbi:MAG: hypothetical protein KDJ50_10925 [Alphaproteobacteria bacterium]|nr:hypothetical protein [Alphaproteobacteria bacterium]